MNYPTLKQVEKATHIQLARWYRFLPSPGFMWIESKKFEEKLNEETDVMNLIIKRLKDKGGITPEISKQIGWDR